MTFTSGCDELNWSVSACSVSSFARVIACQNVISTGFVAFVSALERALREVVGAGAAAAPAVVAPTAPQADEGEHADDADGEDAQQSSHRFTLRR